jgi:hypothetical protein
LVSPEQKQARFPPNTANAAKEEMLDRWCIRMLFCQLDNKYKVEGDGLLVRTRGDFKLRN